MLCKEATSDKHTLTIVVKTYHIENGSTGSESGVASNSDSMCTESVSSNSLSLVYQARKAKY